MLESILYEDLERIAKELDIEVWSLTLEQLIDIIEDY